MQSNLYKYLVRPALGILGVVLCIVILLHTGWGLNLVAQFMLNRIKPFNNASLSVERIDGKPFSRLTLHTVKLISSANVTLVEIDNAEVGYQLLPMLRGEFHLSDVVINNPQLNITRQKDLTWDLSGIVTPDEDTSTTSSTLQLSLNKLTLNNGAIEARILTETRDSTYKITDLGIQLGEFLLAEELSGKLDKLHGKLWTPYTDVPVDVMLAGAYNGKSVQIDSLSLHSANSNVEGKGRIFLSTEDSLLYKNKLSLTAAPLAFDDVRLFLPSLAPGHLANIDLTINNGEKNLTASANLSLSDGAGITFHGSWKGGQERASHIEATGKITNFNPGIIAPDIQGLINADVSAALNGNSIDLLSGSSSVNVYASQLANIPLDSTSITGVFKNGLMRLNVVTGLRDTKLSFAGDASPFKDIPDYDIEGQIVGFNIDPFLENPFKSDVNASVKIKGQGFSIKNMVAALSLQLQPSTINHYDLTGGALSAQIDHGHLLHTLSVSGIQGNISSNGSTFLDNTTTIEQFNLTTQHLDILALTGDVGEDNNQQSSVTASAQVHGQFDPSGTIDVSLETQIEHAQFKQFDLREASLTGAWKAQQIVISSAGMLQSGAYEIEGDISVSEDSITYEITKGTFNNLDVGTFLEDSKQTSNLQGAFFLVGNGFDPATMSLSGQIELQPSRFNQQMITEATTWFALQSDTLNFDLNLIFPAGSTALAGHVTLADMPHYNISKGNFRGIDIGKIAGMDDFSSNLNGAFSLTGQGNNLNALYTRAELTLESSLINRVPILESKTSLEYDASAPSTIHSETQFEDGRLHLEARASSFAEDSSFFFQGAFENVDVAGLIGIDTSHSEVNLHFSGEGNGINPRSMLFKGHARMENSTYKDIHVDAGDVEFLLDQGFLLIDTLSATSNIASFSGRGPIALFHNQGDQSSAFSMTTRLLDLSPLKELLHTNSISARDGQLETRIFGRQGALRIDTRATATGFVFDTFHVGAIDTRITGEFDEDRALNNANITGQVQAVSIPGFVFEEINLEARFDGSETRFSTNSRLDKDRALNIEGSYFIAPENQRLHLDQVNLNLDEDRWQLAHPANIEIGSSYKVENFAIQSGNQRIALDGIIDFEGVQDMNLDIDNFGVGTVADLLGFSGLDGPITSHIDVKGPADAPIIQGFLDMQLITFGREIGDLSINVDYDSLQLKLYASLAHEGVNGATLNGVLPIDLSLTPPEESTTGAGISQNVAMEGGVDFSIDADSMAIDWMLSFIDPATLDRLEGTLTAHIKVGGTAESPTLEGTGRLVDGKIRSPLVGVTYEDFKSDISLRGNTIELTNAEMTSGEGFVSGSGSIELSNLTSATLKIDVTASDFLAINTKEYRATASGNMGLTGSLTSPVLNGNVTVLSADMYLYESSSSEIAELNVQLSEEDLLMLEREFGIRASAADTTTFDFLEAMRMDLNILLERDVWIRSRKNPEMNIQFSGDLEVSKAPFQEYIAFGNIEIIPDRSFINQFGKRFDVTLGNLTFNGPATDPRLNFEALYEVPARRSQENAVTIYLDAEGQLEKLDLSLRAEPSMELTDILSYIATGQPASEALQLGGAGNQSLASTGAGFALNQGVGLLTGAIENFIQSSGLELDVIQIEPSPNAKGATITAGKYVTPRIFTSVSQPIGASDIDGTSTREESTIITLELELIDSLLLRLLGGESVLQINLLWHHAY